MPKSKDMYAVILAGGSGERFWPMSTAKRPKQFLAIPAGKPLICEAVGRIKNLIPEQQIFIITRNDLISMTRSVLPEFPRQNIIGEPCGRDTAAAIALGAALVKRRNPDAAFCVLTSDQLIGNHALFRKTLKESFHLALSSDSLITIGIKPGFPRTGLGYIEAGKEYCRRHGMIFSKVKRFVEKPELSAARKYLRSGKFFWNSGMFIWSVRSLEEAIRKYRPRLLNLMKKAAMAGGSKTIAKTLTNEYAKLEKNSIDYAIMEKAGNIVMAKGMFKWDDIGSWSALESHYRKDSAGNVIVGSGEAIDGRDNIAVAEGGMIALVGVNDLIVVRSGAATLVCAKDKAQEVKKLVTRLNNISKYKGIV
jgi:mannose-1-phosphate guanylyltransferase